MNAAKDKGTRAETAVANYLRYVHDFRTVERRAPSGNQDRGDIAGLPGIVIEVKDHGRMELARWIGEANKEANGDIGVVWHKRRGQASPGDWYVTMDGAAFAALLTEAGR